MHACNCLGYNNGLVTGASLPFILYSFVGQLEKQGTGNGNGNGNGKRERERTTDGAQNGIRQVENALINVRI